MPLIEQIPTVDSITDFIKKNDYVVFSKTWCPFCKKVKDFFSEKSITPVYIELDKNKNGNAIQSLLFTLTGERTVPLVFCHGTLIGGCDNLLALKTSNEFDVLTSVYEKTKKLIENEENPYSVDVAVIGAGSGGIAFAKEAADNGKKVIIFDFVKPTPMNTTWGIGGTCVNVGCVPKKLMHQSAIIGDHLKSCHDFGWDNCEKATHNWNELCMKTGLHIKRLNFEYRKAFLKKNIKYINAFAKLKDQNTIIACDKNNKETEYKAKYIVIAVGERPTYPTIPGIEYCITSDDLFWLKYPPGKTLVVGASYVALECAGALHGFGNDVSVMVRSILLRGFDQEMANRIGSYMKKKEIKFLEKFIPIKVEQIKPIDYDNSQPGRLKVFYRSATDSDGEIYSEEFDSVMFAIGRTSCTSNLGLEEVGIKIAPNKRIIGVGGTEQTHCPNIFCIGDNLYGKLQLTPLAIKAGILLAKRLFAKGFAQCDYTNIPTTVFTPLEYGSIGYSEEDAIAKFGDNDINVYYNYFIPLEEELIEKRDHEEVCYCKLICRASLQDRVIGFHYLGPNAGEVTQGYAVAIRMNATYLDFTRTIGIHPTTSEQFTTLKVTKKSGVEIVVGGC